MDNPIKRKEQELQDNFVDYLYSTYKPKKNDAGEYFATSLEYLTNEMSYMTTATEKEFIEKYGFAPIGFLEILRIQMARTNGYGICITNKSLKKAILSISIDYNIDPEELQRYYEQLVEYHLIVIIQDSNGNEYATTLQQIFNWEYKMWSRNQNNEYQKKKRKKDAEENQKQNNVEKEVIQQISEAPSEPLDYSGDVYFEEVDIDEIF